MKKTFLIALTLLTNFVFAQIQLSDYYDASSTNRQEFSYHIVVRIHKTTGATQFDTRYTATLVQASPDAKGFYNAYGDKKYYSCSQLGDVCKPNNLHLISIRVSYTCNGQQKANVVTFRNLNDVQQMNVAVGAGGEFCEAKDFSMKVMGAALEPMHLGQIMNKINQIGTTKTTQNISNNYNPTTQTISNNYNPTTQTNSKDTPSTESKSYELKLSDIGIPETNASTTSVYQKNYETGQQLSELANNIIDLFTPSPAEIQRREAAAAEYARQKKIAEDLYWEKRILDDRNRFDLLYLPLMDSAIKGNENARMILYFASSALFSTVKVPERQQWFNEAYNNKNPDAYMEVAQEKKEDANWILYAQNAANVGSVDAMLRLADWYDRNKKVIVSGITFTGGDDAKLALEWYTKAAENGSPNAMYYLGMIYKYGQTPSTDNGYGFLKKVFVKHNVVIDEKKALEWFEKSIQPNYPISLFATRWRTITANYVDLSSYFNKESYKELALIYKKGGIVPKDKEKAKELMGLYESYGSHYAKYKF
ncbi:tetratricopeptide repeat protein [Geojedonia litorea]|uniref:Tetratricopeptide repeat protein n=1 Tax=Geojedonia litorea TaxID=1268269 RepID=A0ABV9MY54_9FLAO